MGKLKQLFLIKCGLVLMVLFQNCGEDLDLTAIQQSSTTGPSVSIIAPATYVENSTYSLTASPSNMSNYTIAWYKNGLEEAGENAISYNFDPITLDDSGTYEVVLTFDGQEYRASVVVDVQEDPNAPTTQVFTDTYFTLGGINYYIYSVANFNDTQRQNTANNFCAAKMGAGSTAINYAINPVAQLTQRYAIANDLATCQQSTLDQGYVMGHCLYFLNFNLQLNRYTSVECQR